MKKTGFVFMLAFLIFASCGYASEKSGLDVFVRGESLVVEGPGYEAEILPDGRVNLASVKQSGKKIRVANIIAFFSSYIMPENREQASFRRGEVNVKVKEQSEDYITVSTVFNNEDAAYGYAHSGEEEFTFYAGKNYFDVFVKFTNLGGETNFNMIAFSTVPSSRTNMVYAVDMSRGEVNSGPFSLEDVPSFRGRLDGRNPLFGMADDIAGWRAEFTSLDNYPLQYHFFTVEAAAKYFRHYLFYDAQVFRQAKNEGGRFVLHDGASVSYSIRVSIFN